MRMPTPTPAARAAIGAALAGTLLLWSGPAASAGETGAASALLIKPRPLLDSGADMKEG